MTSGLIFTCFWTARSFGLWTQQLPGFWAGRLTLWLPDLSVLRRVWPEIAILVLLPYVYIALQSLRYRRRNELFRLISENAADMIALVEVTGKRLYNSPAYEKVLGYSPAELAATASLEQVHPQDRERVIEAGKQARITGLGKRLEYRMRHKDGSWRVLESTANPIRNRKRPRHPAGDRQPRYHRA